MLFITLHNATTAADCIPIYFGNRKSAAVVLSDLSPSSQRLTQKLLFFTPDYVLNCDRGQNLCHVFSAAKITFFFDISKFFVKKMHFSCSYIAPFVKMKLQIFIFLVTGDRPLITFYK